MPRWTWLVFAVLGALVPFGLTVGLTLTGYRWDQFVPQAFGSPGAVFLACDLLIAASVFAVWMVSEQRRRPVPHFWVPMVGLFALGFCFALPCWLWLRAGRKEAV